MTINGSKLDVFAFTIYLPDECSSKFYIFHDLAELFGLEFNEEAAKRLKKLLKEDPNDPGAKLSMDREADYRVASKRMTPGKRERVRCWRIVASK
jgi:hypothetical protein